MKLLPPHTTKINLVDRWSLHVLLVFTVLSGIGYATFGRHPEWLQHTPSLAPFFSISFKFFAQGHVLLTGAVLFVYLFQKTQMKWIGAYLAIYVISLSSELTGTSTGYPFGEYAYTSLLGPKWFELVPLLIPLSWFTMAIPAYVMALHAFPGPASGLQTAKRIGLGALVLTIWDLALDPAMSYLTTYWQWGEPGAYYGMPLINLFGWYTTGIVLMLALHFLKADRWIPQLSVRWIVNYYLLVLLLPVLMMAAGNLWPGVALTMLCIGTCLWYIGKRGKLNNIKMNPDGTSPENDQVPEDLQAEQLNAFFAHHSRSFSFAARFFTEEQHKLVTRLYAFCRTTDDIADIYAVSHGKEEAKNQLQLWEEKVCRSYEGTPSGIIWLDVLLTRSRQSGLPFNIISDLIAGVRSDLDKVEFKTQEELNHYTYCVASVVGIWLCYLFGVRDQEVLNRAAALGRAMQLTNIVRDVGEDLKMHRLYLPAKLLAKHGMSKDELLAMSAGTLRPTEAYKILLEDLMEKAEADYHYAFRGLSAVPTSFARAAAVASEVYKGIHKSVRRNKYNNFQRRAYTRWYEKIVLAGRALYRLRKTQHRPFIPANQSLYMANKEISQNGKRQSSLSLYTLIFLCASGWMMQRPLSAMSQITTYSPGETITIQMKSAELSVLDTLRDQYIAAVEDESLIEKSHAMIDSLEHQTPAVQAYQAAFIVLNAKHVFWPSKKMKYLHEGLPKLDSLVSIYPTEVEIRYLRLLSCYYLPRFLGRGDTVEQDLKALAYLLPKAKDAFPPPMYREMLKFVASSKKLDREERENLLPVLATVSG